MLVIVWRERGSLSPTRTHHFWSSADHAPSLGMSARGVTVRPHRNLGQVTGERISLCRLPKHTQSLDFLPFQKKRVYLAHGGIIRFVLIQFLLHGVGEFEHLLVFASIANGRIFAESSTESGDLFGDDIEMGRSEMILGWIVGEKECIWWIESEDLERCERKTTVELRGRPDLPDARRVKRPCLLRVKFWCILHISIELTGWINPDCKLQEKHAFRWSVRLSRSILIRSSRGNEESGVYAIPILCFRCWCGNTLVTASKQRISSLSLDSFLFPNTEVTAEECTMTISDGLPSVKKTWAPLYFGTRALALSKSLINSLTD